MPNGYDDFDEIHVDRVRHSTAKAFLCEIGDSQYWIPKSQISGPDQYPRGYSGPMRVTSWWIETNDLEFLREKQAKAETWELPEHLNESQKIYRRLAAKYHPDRSPETAEMMKDINELWQSALEAFRSK